jgi:hypothetical protein
MPICPAVKNGKWATGAMKLGFLDFEWRLTLMGELIPPEVSKRESVSLMI